MTSRPPAFPPDVAKKLQQPQGEVSFRYTLSASVKGPPPFDRPLMETPYEQVLVALTFDTKLNLRFVRTGSRSEGARVAVVNVASLIGGRRVWDVTLRWSRDEMLVRVADTDNPAQVLEGTWP